MRLFHKLLNVTGQICFFLWILSASFGMICDVEAATSGEDSLYHSHGKRDPFVPLITMTSREAAGLLGVENIDDIIIEGIVYDPKHGSVAIVNGSVLQEGETLGNVKVIEIKPSGAMFSVNGIEGFKTMYQEDVRKQNLEP